MLRNFGIFCFGILMVLSAKAQTASKIVPSHFQWGMEIILDPEHPIGDHRLIFEEPLKIYQNGDLIGEVVSGKDFRWRILLTSSQYDDRRISIRGWCYVHYGVRADYFKIDEKAILLDPTKRFLSVRLRPIFI
jgi:hypothetical protein